MHFEFGNKWSSSCVCLFLFRLMSIAQGKAKCAYIDWLMTVKLIFFVVMKEWPEFLNTFGIHYICVSLLLLRVESRDFSQAEKDSTACKAEQIHKMTTIFTQNVQNDWKWMSFCKFAQLCKQFFLFELEKNHVTQITTAEN